MKANFNEEPFPKTGGVQGNILFNLIVPELDYV